MTLEVKDAYSVDQNDNLGEDFFKPCLERCSAYYRAAGFFSSSALQSWAGILPRIQKDSCVRIKLLISPILSEEDRQLLEKANSEEEQEKQRAILADKFFEDATEFMGNPEDISLRGKVLLWLIANDKLEIKFVFTSRAIFHEKYGVFEFDSGESVSFIGSANESRMGHFDNVESIDVFRSWIDNEKVRVDRHRARFLNVWGNKNAYVKATALSEESVKRIKVRAPMSFPESDTEGGSATPTSDKKRPLVSWEHQDTAILKYITARHGILEMATGTGKTRTALRILDKLCGDNIVDTAIVTAYGNDLLRQWKDELYSFPGANRLVVVPNFDGDYNLGTFEVSPKGKILLCSIEKLPRALAFLNSAPDLAKRALVIYDEAHKFGSPENIKTLKGLSDNIEYRLGLSATPEREYDAEGSGFISSHIGPVVFRYGLEDAIGNGVLSPFHYHLLEYELTEEDKREARAVYKRYYAHKDRMSPEEIKNCFIQMASVPKKSKAKIEVFKKFIRSRPDLLSRCIIFVHNMEYGNELMEVIHSERPDFHTYFGGEDKEVLQRFSRSEIECLITCHRLSEGIDIRNLRNVILFSCDKAKLETIQRIGRCLRTDPTNPGKQANVVDFIKKRVADLPMSDFGDADEERSRWLKDLSRVRYKGAYEY